MANRGFALRSGFWLFLALLVLAGAGCRKIRPKLGQVSPEGVEHSSYPIQLSGYQQTITVNASPAEISAYLSDLNNLILPGYRTEEMKAAIEEQKPLELGSTFPASVNRMGVQIQGQMIVVQRDEANMWWVFDNPDLFTTQRWEIKPVGAKTRITLRVEYELPPKYRDLAELAGVIEGIIKDVDTMLAGIQAHFDPSLDPERLLAVGVRGESYDSLIQVNEVRVRINAPPLEVVEWAMDPGNNPSLLHFDSECPYQEIPESGVLACQTSFINQGVNVPVDLFRVRKEGKNNFERTYLVIGGLIGFYDSEINPEGDGSRLLARLVFETPGPMSSQGMDALMAMAGIPRELEKLVLAVKNGVENRN